MEYTSSMFLYETVEHSFWMYDQHKSFVWAEPGVTTQTSIGQIVHAHITTVSLRVVETWVKSKVLEDRSGASPMSSVEYTLEDSISTAMFHSGNMPTDEHCISNITLEHCITNVVVKAYIFERVKYR
jgi:hypothetical protein